MAHDRSVLVSQSHACASDKRMQYRIFMVLPTTNIIVLLGPISWTASGFKPGQPNQRKKIQELGRSLYPRCGLSRGVSATEEDLPHHSLVFVLGPTNKLHNEYLCVGFNICKQIRSPYTSHTTSASRVAERLLTRMNICVALDRRNPHCSNEKPARISTVKGVRDTPAGGMFQVPSSSFFLLELLAG